MTTLYEPEIWLNAAVDSVNDFVANGLNDSAAIPSNLEYSMIEKIEDLHGSYLTLSCDNDVQIQVGLLVNQDNLEIITRKMLFLPPSEKLTHADMVDALKEAVNIISGGIKSRLSDQVCGEILLGIPCFIAKAEGGMEKKADLLQYVTIGKICMCVYISIHRN